MCVSLYHRTKIKSTKNIYRPEPERSANLAHIGVEIKPVNSRRVVSGLACGLQFELCFWHNFGW